LLTYREQIERIRSLTSVLARNCIWLVGREGSLGSPPRTLYNSPDRSIRIRINLLALEALLKDVINALVAVEVLPVRVQGELVLELV